jgi:Zn-dependent protease/CBS domain-containing protein
LRIGRIAGIDVYMHVTFPLLLAWTGYDAYLRGGNWATVLSEISFVLVLFSIVVLHELGHALAARRYGVGTRDITLLPIGGVARLERMPREPRQELVIALAGPAVNVVLAALCAAWLAATGGSLDPRSLMLDSVTLVEKLWWINVSLIVFNLLPAFPMDGGRVLRALLAMKFDHAQATRVAARVGQGMALLFALLGLYVNTMLVVVALFVWFAAGREARMAQVSGALDSVTVSRAMITDFHTLGPDETVARAIGLTLEGFQQDFPIVDAGSQIVGMLSRATLVEVLDEIGETTPVREVMEVEFPTANPREMLPDVLDRMQAAQVRALPVVLQGEVVGLVTLDNLGEFLSIQAALMRRARRARQAADQVADGRLSLRER